MPRWLPQLATVLSVLGGVALFVVFARSIDLRATWAAIARANLALLLLATLANALATALRAWRWQFLLEPKVSLARLVRYTFAAYAANNVLPARAGEALAAWEVARREQLPFSKSAASLLLGHLMDAVSLLPLVAPLPFVLALPLWVKRLLVGVILVAVVGLVIAVWFAGLRSPRAILGSFVTSLLAWVLEVVVVLAVLRAVGIEISWWAGPLLMLIVNLLIALPSAPASVGAHEAGSMAALQILAVSGPAALSFALAFHAVQIISVMVPGVPFLQRIVAERVKAKAAPGTYGPVFRRPSGIRAP
jgi:glycosyltransferase 2 family protein